MVPAIDAIRSFLYERFEGLNLEVKMPEVTQPKMSAEGGIEFSIEIGGLDMSHREIRMLEIALYRLMGQIKKVTGKDNIGQAFAEIQRITLIARIATTALYALNAAEGPVGWLFAITSVSATGFAIGGLFSTTTDIVVEMS
jgi:hypothetical protein